jgi:hemerythrin-like metal-binding protein
MIEAGWSDQYVIGYEALDTQHEELFDLCDTIFQAQTDDEVRERFADFRTLLKWHFDQEDMLMAFICYPKMEEHMQMHNDMVNRLDALNVHGISDIPAFTEFVKVWILGHIQLHDMEIADFRSRYIEYTTQLGRLAAHA